MKKSATIIRMGAAHWDVSMPNEEGEHGSLYFNLRTMTRDERRKFHAGFMGAYRIVNPMKERRAA